MVQHGGPRCLSTLLLRFHDYKFSIKPLLHVRLHYSGVSGSILSARWMTMWRVPSRRSDISVFAGGLSPFRVSGLRPPV